MAGLTGITSQALQTPRTFNWTWFIELVTSGILVIWFLFYLNRLFATLVSYGIRAYTWHKFRVYIDIKSLQISFLGGRIFFKGVRYHGENETVYIHNGHVTWRYWLRVTRQIDLSDSKSRRFADGKTDYEEKDSRSNSPTGSALLQPARKDTESRIAVSVTGLEWFIYNRTPVYDSIISEAGAKATGGAADGDLSASNAFSKTIGTNLTQHARVRHKSIDTTSDFDAKFEAKSGLSERISSKLAPVSVEGSDQESLASNAVEAETDVSAFYSIMLRLFPLGIECSRGAISIGNEHTKAIIVTTFDKARGHIDATASGPADIFRQVFEFDVEHPIVQMKPNPDYRLPQVAAAERIITGHEAVLKRRPWWRPRLDILTRRRTFRRSLRNLVPFFRSSVTSFHAHPASKEQDRPYSAFTDAQPDAHDWHGLDRYMDEDEGDDHQAWLQIEYARFSTIFDCPRVHLNFYWDTPGDVKPDHPRPSHTGHAIDLNGIAPPAYGLHLDVYGGLVNYGPWSDRLRVEVQNVFFPPSFKTAEPKRVLEAGDARLSSIMAITVDIKEEITLRVPTRESTKDWRWRGRATAVRDAAAFRKQQQRRHFRFRRSNKRRLGPDVRPFGWIAVAAGAHSKVRYVMDMYPGIDGYRNTLQLSLRNTKATSSVNHATLWECKEQEVSADLSNPLGWNDLHSWRFDIMNNNMDLYLLRDHTFLLLDLISDFTAGQKSDYMTFMPFIYTIGIRFLDLNLYLNANDNNIIDSPCDQEANTFLILGFSRLVGQVDIPMTNFSPAQNSVKFQGSGQDAYLLLKTPSWHTLNAFGQDTTMATLKTLSLEGSYNYFSATNPTLTDSLLMAIVGGGPKFSLQGYLIRYFMNVKDNYFGDTIHFSTLEEYQTRLDRAARGEEEKKAPPKKQNDLDVILSVRAENAIALMPANIYQQNDNLRVDVMLVEADMRFTNYYMDLQVDSSPIEVSLESKFERHGKVERDATGCQLFIDGVDVYGHRLFGAPPTEPTYLCNWDFDIGEITGECTSTFVQTLALSIMAFIFTMDDDENALPKSESAVIPDVTFLRARAAGVRAWVISADTAFLVQVAPTNIELNDWANKHFSKYVKISVPLFLVAAVDSKSAYRQRDLPDRQVTTYACLRTAVNLVIVNRKANFSNERAIQQAHIRFHDSRTHRAGWLLHKQSPQHANPRSSNWSRQPPAMPIPLMPEPVSLSKSVRAAAVTSRLSAASRQPRNFPMSTYPVHESRATPHQTTMNPSLHSTSSAWMKPSFPLQNIEPDLKYMPFTWKEDNVADNSMNPDPVEDEDFPSTDEAFKHDGIFCDLSEGITGFCTPELASSIVTLINEISPSNPDTILDDIQMQVVSNVKKSSNKRLGQIDDVAIRLPFTRLRVVNCHERPDKVAGFDQHDLQLGNVRLTMRIAPQSHAQTSGTRVLAHLGIRDVKFEVAERLCTDDQYSSGAAITMSDANVWLSLGSGFRARTQVGEVEVITGGKSLDSLAGLIQRSETVVSTVMVTTQNIELPQRTQHLLYHLTEDGRSTEPHFLARPVNVLRTAEQHVRLHDSWKIVCQLRQSLQEKSANDNAHTLSPGHCLQEDRMQVRRHIMSSFDRWRSWENTGLNDDALVQAVFGAEKVFSGSQRPIDTEVELLLGRAALTIDPGPRQSQLFIQSLDLNLSEKSSSTTGPFWEASTRAQKHKVLQAYCGSLGCHLHWELLDLTERIIRLSEPYLNRSATAEPGSGREGPASSQSEDATIVLGADAASLEIISENLMLLSGVERFKASFTAASGGNSHQGTSLTLNAASGRLRLRSMKKGIFGCKITRPTLYISLQDASGSSENKLKLYAAANCEQLRLHLKEDILGLLKLSHLILTHEVGSVRALMQAMPSKAMQNEMQPSRQTKARVTVEPHVALFLDDYLLRFDLMPYLRYQISGTIARTSLVPRDHTRFNVQLDVKENSHSFDNPRLRAGSSKSVLSMPPLSVFVTVGISPDHVIFGVHATIEQMLLEASAVRACFDAAYQPQTIDYVKAVKYSIAKLQKAAEADLDLEMVRSQTSTRDQASRRIIYTGDLVFEGIRMLCSAPALRPDQDYKVNLSIILATTTMRLSNTNPTTQACVKKPHFDFVMPQIVVRLERVRQRKEHFGQLSAGFRITGVTEIVSDGHEIQDFRMVSAGISLDLFVETAVLAVDLITFLQARIKSLAAAEDAKKLKPLRRLTMAAPEPGPSTSEGEETQEAENESSSHLLDSTFSIELNAICLRWLLSSASISGHVEDMVLTVNQIDLKTTREASARLAIKSTQLQLVPRHSSNPFERTANSALLPEMIFNAAYARSMRTRKFAFKAAGKLLDIRLASNFILPAAAVQKSLAMASLELRALKLESTTSTSQAPQAQLPRLLGTKRLAQLLVFADFAGAQVTVTPTQEEVEEVSSAFGFLKGAKRSRAGRYGQAVQSATGQEATLRAPGVAFQIQYADDGEDDPTLSTEVRVAASSNTLAPSVVPLILEITSSVTNLMEQDNSATSKRARTSEDGGKEKANQALQQSTDPTAVLGRVKLNAGLWVQKQEFSLTCQPIARVSATARFDEIFVVVNTVQPKDQDRFFSISTTFSNLATSVQHVYSRESTASFAVDSIMVSLMNSKHFSDKSGISAILDISPMKAYLNAKQMQDFLLFREIWYPTELRSDPQAVRADVSEIPGQGPAIQKFQEATGTAVLPWHAIISIREVRLQVDFGQSIGKSDFAVEKLWASSKKNSDSEQNLCIGFSKVGIESTGRMSGFVELQGFRVRTAIRWPLVDPSIRAPLVQGSIGFEHLKAKTVFDYQPFAVVDVSSFDFLIYNVRQGLGRDRLVGILDGGKVQVFCTTAAAAQVYSISQAFERLIQEKQEAFESSLHELDRYLMRRKSVFPSTNSKSAEQSDVLSSKVPTKTSHAPSLHVDVVITLRAIDAGFFMSSFFDDMTLKLEAIDVQTRFAVGEANDKTHSGLGMSLGQVQLALSNMGRPNSKALGEVLVTEVIDRATNARGGTILKVPRLVASMQTWQRASANVIEYIFQSTFHGKVDIGWNYSRISTIRRMWENHSRALAQKTNKPLPSSAIKITAEPKNEAGGDNKEKITAVVNMPQSKYEYIALEPPIIDTPQLRDLGEATPSLEWIGLHRERLPHVTHSVLIVSLLEVAKEVEDSYTRILGSG